MNLFILLYINDLETYLKKKNTMLYSSVNDPVTATKLNYDLNLINKWVNHWKMAFHPDPKSKLLKCCSLKKGIKYI